MTFAILLLGLLVVACAVGSFVTQGQTYEWYAATYSETAAAWIVALHLDDAFHSWWFNAITAFFVRKPAALQRTAARLLDPPDKGGK